jgi:6-pyruvoyltetrahydropterin/6-carboxytetrahydropterin synthase
MRFELSQKFYFDAAHTLQRAIETEGSKRIHGHTYSVEVTVAGEQHADTGMVIDLGLLRQEIAVVREMLDHHLLDEVPGIGVPTLENLCAFIAQRLNIERSLLQSVKVWRDGVGDSCTLRLN